VVSLPPNLEQPNHLPVEKPSTFAARDEAFLVILGAGDVSTYDQKVRTFFRPGNLNMVWEESTDLCESSQAEGASSRLVFAARIPLPILPTPRGLVQHASHRDARGVDFRWNRADISTDRAGNCHNGSFRSVYIRDRPET
jgi:hypothetical protein